MSIIRNNRNRQEVKLTEKELIEITCISGNKNDSIFDFSNLSESYMFNKFNDDVEHDDH